MSDKAESLSPAAGRGMEPKIEFTLDTYEQCMAKPYRMLPPEVRPAVLEFRLFFQRFFPDPMEICFMFAAWMRDDGLTAEEAVAVMRDARRPVNVGKFKFASDLTTHVGAEIDRRRVAREKAEANARQLAELAAGAEPLPPETQDAFRLFRKRLADGFTPPPNLRPRPAAAN